MIQPNLLDNETAIRTDADGLFLEHTQAITSEFLDSLHFERTAKATLRYGEHNKVASVPTFVWELWTKQGRDPVHATPRQIVQWLRADNLDHFVATEKSV